jgi:cytochrome c-type biogenesis protein CcmE
MAGLKKKRRIRLILIGLALLVTASGLIGYAMRDGASFFRSPSEVAESPPSDRESFNLGGLVEDGSWERNGTEHRFIITDGAESVPVVYVGILPDLFREGQGTIATGSLDAGVFRANKVLAKHDEKYMPKEVADALKKQGVFKPSE